MAILNRRDLAKVITSGVVTAATPWASAQAGTMPEAAAAVELTWTNVHPGVWRARVGEPEAVTPVRSRLIPADANGLASLPPATVKPLAITGAVGERGCLLHFALRPREFVYGFGLQLLSTESRGKKRTIRVNADPRFDTGDSHAPVPFYVTTEGYGILVDTARTADFHVGDARLKPTHPLAPGSAEYKDPSGSKNLADTDFGEVVVDVPHARGVDVYFFAGPTMMLAVQRYNLFSGGGVVPPAWGLGFWYRGDVHSSQEDIVTCAKDLRERKIPCDVLGLEAGWHSHSYSCTFVWDQSRFPKPVDMLKELSSLQMKTNLWEHCFTHPSSPIFPALLPHSGDFGVWGGLVPDFQQEAGRKAFGDYHGKHLIDLGVSGFKLDECDGSDYTGGWSFPNCSTFPSGADGEQMHALLGMRYQHTLLEQFQQRKQSTFGLVRSSGALAAPYPFVLYSDLYDHRQFIRGIVTSGFSGLLWCPEVRDAKAPEDLIRRLQSVVFSPLAMINGWYIKNPPWKQIDRKLNNAGQFADGWEILEARCREIIGWRMQLIPYLLSAFRRYALDGTPPFRALALDYPGPDFQKVDDQYMVGDRMIVAPLFYGEAERKVLLPPGKWHDFWTGKELDGGSMLHISSSTANIPVFIKSGSVFPLAQITASTEDPDNRKLSVRVFGDGSLPWTTGGSPDSPSGLAWDPVAGKGRSMGRNEYTVMNWERLP